LIEAVRSRRRARLEELGRADDPCDALQDLLRGGAAEPALADMYVVKVLEAVPGLGKVVSRRLLDARGVEHRRAIADLEAAVVGDLCDDVRRERAVASAAEDPR
jgi:hypothetical protein